jgi:hypothetical protein
MKLFNFMDILLQLLILAAEMNGAGKLECGRIA